MVKEQGEFLPKANQGTDISQFPPRQRILAAALKLFVEQGYFNTNVPDLSRESRCSIGSIYHTFKNKEEIASTLYRECISAFRGAVGNSVITINDPEKLIRTVVISFLQFSEVNHQLSKYIWLCRHNEFLGSMVKYPTVLGFDQLGRHLTRVLRKGTKDKILREVPAPVVWSALFGIPLAYVRDWMDGYMAHAPKEVAEELAEACWRALKA